LIAWRRIGWIAHVLGRRLSPWRCTVLLRAGETRATRTKTALVHVSAAIYQDEAAYADEDDEKSEEHAKFSVQSKSEAADEG
jgi:hypothetical protein